MMARACAQENPINMPRQVLFASLGGTTAEFFDFYIYGMAGGAGCTMMFLDRTKNHRRRWCSMVLCDNHVKVAAHRAR